MLKKIALIIFPLLIGVEVADEIGILDRLAQLFNPILKYFKLPKEASIPLLVAQIFGLTYGAGVILRSVEEDQLSASDLMTLAIFLVICHAAIEDTLLFAALGANGLIILGMRVVLAIVITYLYAKYFVEKDQLEIEKLREVDCC
ncbi:nucleoside recognition domain-containing protein [Halobacteroides halobius]|nr:nucleoside recognition domain-containing protein [Halobacteroides halobius]